tara:strand:+ start:11119 stop:11928 length:810 start_codon:yes stop_codon:yes gene_type:complete
MINNKFDKHISSFYELCKDLGRVQLDGQKDLNVILKSDNSPVTNIDIYSSEIIVSHISENFKGDVIVSEESDNTNHTNSSYWLVDPIDGTKNYINGGKDFCICIAYIKDNYPVFGIIYIPSKNEFYYAIQNKGSYLINEKFVKPRSIKNQVTQNNIYVSSAIREKLVNMLKANFKDSNIIFMSSAVKFARIAEGKGHLSLRLGPTHEWDTAAGQCIIEETGGHFLDKNLERFSYGHTNNYRNGPFFVLNGDIKKYESTIIQSLSLVGST